MQNSASISDRTTLHHDLKIRPTTLTPRTLVPVSQFVPLDARLKPVGGKRRTLILIGILEGFLMTCCHINPSFSLNIRSLFVEDVFADDRPQMTVHWRSGWPPLK